MAAQPKLVRQRGGLVAFNQDDVVVALESANELGEIFAVALAKPEKTLHGIACDDRRASVEKTLRVLASPIHRQPVGVVLDDQRR